MMTNMATNDSPLYLGMDLSTQQLKGVLVNAQGNVETEFLINFDQDFPKYKTTNGRYVKGDEVTAPVYMWIEAIDLLLQRISSANMAHRIQGISGAAQQHGSVYWKQPGIDRLTQLDESMSMAEQLQQTGAFVLTDTPIWEDSSTTQQCHELEQKAAGSSAELARITGSSAYERFTGPQILKQKGNPGWEQISRISLVSSFIASLLTGKIAPVDVADASGTNLYDVVKGKWSQKLCEYIDGGSQRLLDMLGPEVVMANQSVGQVSSYLVNRYGLVKRPVVVAFTGDNPAAYAGFEELLGGSEQNTTAMLSLGTSDTVLFPVEKYPYTAKNQGRQDGHIMRHPTESRAFIAMLCYKNGSLVREWVRDNSLSGECEPGSWNSFSQYIDKTQLAPDLFGFYYLAAEILPQGARGIHRFKRVVSDKDIQGAVVECPTGAKYTVVENASNNDARAIAESQFLSMRLDYLKKSPTTKLSAIAATGGASGNLSLLQVMSDIFGVPIFTVSNTLAGNNTLAMPAFGGALRAMEYCQRESDNRYSMQQVCSPDMEMYQRYTKCIEDFAFLRQCVLNKSKIE